MKVNKYFIKIFTLFVSMSVLSVNCYSDDMESIRYETLHEIVIDGKKSGTIESKYVVSNSEKIVNRHTKININVLLVFKYSLEVLEDVTFKAKKLSEYNMVSNEDGVRLVIKAVLNKDNINVESTENGKKDKSNIKVSAFDVTSEDASALFLNEGIDSKSFRVLDLDLYEILPTKYTRKKREDVVFLGKKVSCHVLSYKNKEVTGTQWLYRHNKQYLLLKEEIEDSEGRFSLNLVSLKGLTLSAGASNE